MSYDDKGNVVSHTHVNVSSARHTHGLLFKNSTVQDTTIIEEYLGYCAPKVSFQNRTPRKRFVPLNDIMNNLCIANSVLLVSILYQYKKFK